MGGGGSALRGKSSAPVVQRQPCETTTSYRIRVKFQQDGPDKNKDNILWRSAVEAHFNGGEAYPIEEILEVFHKKFSVNVSMATLKSYYGMTETSLAVDHIQHLFADLAYNPSIGAIYAALIKDRESLTEPIWNEFLSEFQGYPDSQWGEVGELLAKHLDQKGIPQAPQEFSQYLLSAANAAFHPRLSHLQRFDRPIAEYFMHVAKVQDVSDCADASAAVAKLAACVARGARVVELACSGNASDGEPRVLGDVYPAGHPVDDLPGLRRALEAIEAAAAQAYKGGESRLDTLCHATGHRVERMPIIVCISVAETCGPACQLRVRDHLNEVFKERVECPALNGDGRLWSPLQLDGKVLVVGSANVLVQPPDRASSDEMVDPDEEPPLGAPLEPALLEAFHMKMVSVKEIRPILDEAKSRSDLRRLLQGLMLTLTAVELCAHIMELSSITDMLLVHVQTSKRKIFKEKQGNLSSDAVEEHSLDQDTRHMVQFSELRSGESADVRFETKTILEEKQDEVEPLRGWRYGAQIVAVDSYSRGEANLQNMTLFKQHGCNGFVPRIPRDMLYDLNGYVDLYQDFSAEYARSLFVTILSACRIPRPQNVRQPFLRVYCNNGTGLKQVAITSTVEDNGFNCVWEEDFEFKFHINDLNAAACLLFVIQDRDGLDGGELAWSSVPLWGLQPGYRSLQINDMDGTPVQGAALFTHFDWEPEE